MARKGRTTRRRTRKDPAVDPRLGLRRGLMLGVMTLAVGVLGWRAVDLQVARAAFLQDKADAVHLRTRPIAAHRGVITDRHGEPLAISSPVQSVWINPRVSGPQPQGLDDLAALLQLDPGDLRQMIEDRQERSFVYLRRHVSPDVAGRVRALEVPGVDFEKEYRRYYPAGEVVAHLVGFTNIDDKGQEGVELAYNDWLGGRDGSERIVRDGRRRIIAHAERVEPARPGKDLALSIDRRLQYLAYRELKAAVQARGARNASAVLLDVQTGEVLVMVNQPAYNPNSRRHLKGDRYRNRAVTDVFEPGSTIKPFVVAAGIESGQFEPGSTIDTAPGEWKFGSHTIRDHRNYGTIDLAMLLKKSSNIGAARIASDLPAADLWGTLSGFGFGDLPGSSYPGESAGVLSPFERWQPIDHATLGFGYGLSVSALQLARAYSVLASGGSIQPSSIVRVEEPVAGVRVIDRDTADKVAIMLEGVVSADGTGSRARVPGYRVAGKTGTARKSIAGGYSEDRYRAMFAGFAPVSSPRLALVVVIDEPQGEEYYGGQVAAPVFARIMAGALRLLDISPDDLAARRDLS